MEIRSFNEHPLTSRKGARSNSQARVANGLYQIAPGSLWPDHAALGVSGKKSNAGNLGRRSLPVAKGGCLSHGVVTTG